MSIINNFLHWLSHVFGYNTGKVVTYAEGDYIVVGFECDYCKKIDETSIDRIPISKICGINNVLEES